MSDPETIRIYDARATDYAQRFSQDGPRPILQGFIAALPRGGRVLDLGCGPGRSAVFMADAGLEVEAWDASAAMIALVSRDPRIAARQAEFDALDARDAYDGIWCNFSLLHAPREAMPGHLAAIATALKPGGHLHIALKTGEGARRDGLGRFYCYYTEEALDALLRAAGLTPIGAARGEEAGLDGTVAPWIAVLARG